MAGEFPVDQLGKLAELDTGFAFKSAEFSNEGVRLARGDNVKRGQFEWGEKAKFWPAVTAELTRYQLDVGDVLIGMDGSRVGENWVRVSEADLPALLVQRVARLRAKPGNDQNFIWYLIANERFVRYIKGVATGTSIPHISGTQIRDFEVPAPLLGVQRQISAVLRSIDEKIDLNRQMAATLEEMARALFKSWFVDFDPVQAKSEGRDTGLPPDITALFPNSFDDERVPDGWRSGSLDDLADTNSESWKASSHPEEIEYVDLSNCKWGNIDGTTQYRWEDAPSRGRRVARAGDTIFGTVRPGNGSYAFVGKEGLTVSTGFAVLRPRKVIYREMVYLAATSIDNIRWLEQLAAGHGGAYPAVNPDKVSATAVTVPCEKVAEAFASSIAGMIDRIESLKQESTDLEQLRDALLPRLLSGELRVADAETVTAAA